MSTHKLPEAAVEAAARSFYVNLTSDAECHPRDLANIRAALEAAAPHIIAEALVEAGNDLAGDSIGTHWDRLNAEFKSDGGGSVSPRNDAYLDGLEESREFLYLRARVLKRTIT